MENAFGKNLLRLRQNAGLSRKAFADAMKLPATTVQGYETAGREPRLDNLIKFADYFGVTVDELVKPADNSSKFSFSQFAFFTDDLKAQVIDLLKQGIITATFEKRGDTFAVTLDNKVTNTSKVFVETEFTIDRIKPETAAQDTADTAPETAPETTDQ